MFNRLCLLLGCGLALPVLAQVGYLETPVQPASGQSALNFANGEDALRDGRTTVYGSGELEHALGDGSTDAGAKKLDQMRHRIRKHKRGAKASKIPPKAKGLSIYMKEAA